MEPVFSLASYLFQGNFYVQGAVFVPGDRLVQTIIVPGTTLPPKHHFQEPSLIHGTLSILEPTLFQEAYLVSRTIFEPWNLHYFRNQHCSRGPFLFQEPSSLQETSIFQDTVLCSRQPLRRKGKSSGPSLSRKTRLPSRW